MQARPNTWILRLPPILRVFVVRLLLWWHRRRAAGEGLGSALLLVPGLLFGRLAALCARSDARLLLPLSVALLAVTLTDESALIHRPLDMPLALAAEQDSPLLASVVRAPAKEASEGPELSGADAAPPLAAAEAVGASARPPIGMPLPAGIVLPDAFVLPVRDSATAFASLSAESEALLYRQIGKLGAEVLLLRSLFKQLADMAELEGGEFLIDSAPLLELVRHQDELLAMREGKPVLAAAMPTGQGVHLRPISADARAAGKLLDLAIRALGPISEQADRLERLYTDRRVAHDASVRGSPVPDGRISSGFGVRRDPFNSRRRMHRGLDFVAAPGTRVTATADGVVTFAGSNGAYGLLVEIEHGDGYKTRYAHNQALLVSTGERVVKGQGIARLGSSGRSTGPHLHYEVRRHGQALDPASFLR